MTTYSVNDRPADLAFHSVTDFLAACEGGRYSAEDSRWAGGLDYDGNARLALRGWDQEVTVTDHVAARVADLVWSQRTLAPATVTRYDVSGGEVDIDRYLHGEPECLREQVPFQVARAGRAVRLVIHNGVRHSVTPQVYRGRGAAVVTLLDALQRAQHPLEIWAGSDAHGVSRQRGGRWSYVVKIQDASDPLDIGRVTYFASHPGAHRALGFAIRTSPDGGRGSIGGSEPLGAACVPDDGPGTTIVLPQLTESSRWTDAESAAWVIEQLDRIGLGEPLAQTT